MSRSKKNVISKEKAEEVVKEVYNVADFCRAVGWQPRGANYQVFYKYVKEYNLDISHFTGRKTNLGNKNKVGLSKEEFFKKDKLIKSSDLIKKIISTNDREYKCEVCGITKWQGKELKLQVHHIDGDHLNNELSNLQLICPNCHSQTDTYAGKKNKKGVCTLTHKRERKYKCSVCGKALHRNPKTGMCAECLRKSYKEKKNQ